MKLEVAIISQYVRPFQIRWHILFIHRIKFRFILLLFYRFNSYFYHQRLSNNNFYDHNLTLLAILSKTCAHSFYFNLVIEIEDLAKLVTAYQQRKFDEDVSYLENELGGN